MALLRITLSETAIVIIIIAIIITITAIIITWESNPPPPIIKYMCLYPGLAIVAHAQYSELINLLAKNDS